VEEALSGDSASMTCVRDTRAPRSRVLALHLSLDSFPSLKGGTFHLVQKDSHYKPLAMFLETSDTVSIDLCSNSCHSLIDACYILKSNQTPDYPSHPTPYGYNWPHVPKHQTSQYAKQSQNAQTSGPP
jgi:hypothetical protein